MRARRLWRSPAGGDALLPPGHRRPRLDSRRGRAAGAGHRRHDRRPARRHGQDAHVAAIGPAGESLVRYASVVTDYAFAAARYGVGAVFGSKNLKAIVCVGDAPASVADPDALAGLAAFYREAIPGNRLAALQRSEPGFAGWVGEPAARLPGRAKLLRDGKEGPAAHRPARLRRAGGGDRGRMYRLPQRLPQGVRPAGSAERRSGGLGQEAVLSLGWNLGIDDLDTVLGANALCHDLGLDPVSLGGTLAFAMECASRGLLPAGPVFGDTGALDGLIRDVAARGGALGDLLAEGSARAARRIGPAAEPYAMTVKGAEVPCFDPRAQPGVGLGYARGSERPALRRAGARPRLRPRARPAVLLSRGGADRRRTRPRRSRWTPGGGAAALACCGCGVPWTRSTSASSPALPPGR